MKQDCWTPNKENGFLMSPDPISNLTKVDSGIEKEAVHEIEEIAQKLPKLVATNEIRSVLRDLKAHDMNALKREDDFRIVERAFQIYAHLANVYIWCEEDNPENHIPKGVAMPLVQLAEIVERPPIIPYATTALSNYKRIDPNGPIEVDNLECVQKIIDIEDESWFHLIHVEIEAHAGKANYNCLKATEAISNNDPAQVEAALNKIPKAFDKMMATFRRMFEKCNPDNYYHTLRPYLFGFTDIIYHGVEKFNEEPQTFRGETGAQSSVIPALRSFLGLQHEKGGLSEHLEIMKDYMPKPHRELLANIDSNNIRSFVINENQGSLKDAYNASIESVYQFRNLHLKMAHAFVAQKVKNPIGTGGTEFMHWLKQLRDETNQQYIS